MTRLDECGDVLTIDELAAVLQRSVRWIEQRLANGTFPIPRLASLGGRRWARADVRRFLEHDATSSLPARRRVS